MRNLLALIGLLVVGFLGLGWYLDWYRVAREPGPDGTQRLQVDIDSKKIGADVQHGLRRGSEILDELSKEAGKAGGKNDPPAALHGPPAPAALPGPAPPPGGPPPEQTGSPWWYPPPGHAPAPPQSNPAPPGAVSYPPAPPPPARGWWFFGDR